MQEGTVVAGKGAKPCTGPKRMTAKTRLPAIPRIGRNDGRHFNQRSDSFFTANLAFEPKAGKVLVGS